YGGGAAGRTGEAVGAIVEGDIDPPGGQGRAQQQQTAAGTNEGLESWMVSFHRTLLKLGLMPQFRPPQRFARGWHRRGRVARALSPEARTRKSLIRDLTPVF